MSLIESGLNTEKEHDPRHRPTLDGLRAGACLLVVIKHLLETAKIHEQAQIIGSVGVLIFFSLSGFLMGFLYLSQNCTAENVAKYAIARFSRITPAYYIAILVYAALHILLSFYDTMSPLHIIRCFLFAGSVGVFWSIGPEVQFYTFFAGIWLAVREFKKKNFTPLVIMAIVSCALVASRSLWPGILLPSKLHIFLFGVMSALLIRKEAVKSALTRPIVQISLLCACLGYFVFLITQSNIFDDLLFPAIISLTIASLSATTFVTYVFQLKWIRFIGAASFSIYLFHEPVTGIVNKYFLPLHDRNLPGFVPVAILAVAIPSLFYVFVEKNLNALMKRKLSGWYDRGGAPLMNITQSEKC